MRKTQEQMYWESHRKVADINNTFMEMVTEPNPITKTELRKNIEHRPELWGRFSRWLESEHIAD